MSIVWALLGSRRQPPLPVRAVSRSVCYDGACANCAL